MATSIQELSLALGLVVDAVNIGLLTQICDIMKQVDSGTEFGTDGDVVVFANVPCALDTIILNSPLPVATPIAPTGRQQGMLFIVDSRLGRLPMRKFDTTNYVRLDGSEWEIGQINEAINRLTGELDHLEVIVYEGINR